VAQLVVQNGFPAEQVAALLGGYEAWVNGGHPVTLAE